MSRPGGRTDVYRDTRPETSQGVRCHCRRVRRKTNHEEDDHNVTKGLCDVYGCQSGCLQSEVFKVNFQKNFINTLKWHV